MNARACALRVLSACRTSGAWADAALAAQLNGAQASPQDAALASRIVYGVLQTRMLLDWTLGAFCTQRLDHLQQPLPDILRIGAYQILFLDKVPDSAAVNESVQLAKENQRGAAAGLVNAVLRRLSRSKDALPAVPEAQRLSIETSHPQWLCDRITAILGAEEAERFLRANNEIAPITVQINPLRAEEDALCASLRGEGLRVTKHAWAPGCFELAGVGELATLPEFYRGQFTVQDAAARCVSLAAGLRGGERVLDVCAAPGGKSFSAAFAMGDRGSILACDKHENKLKRIREGAARLGLASIETAAADGRVYRPEWDGAFDAVLCDVPCSGLGIIRKKPDIRYKDPAELADLPEIQSAILSNSARYVKENGLLIYSTCTVLPEENEDVTDAFLKSHPDFCYEPFDLPIGTTDGRVTLWPQRHGTDGFYIAKLRRRAHD